jgi:hypothetical protein
MKIELSKNKHESGNVTSAIFALFGILAVFIVALIYGIISYGYVGMILWSWFIVPVFGLPTLTVYQAWGISTVVAFLCHQHISDKVEDSRTSEQKIVEAVMLFAKPWVILGIVYIVKSIWQ